ncbi:hypothetical protein [Tolypothrix sp. VBCCA 56010]|uniref:hypothetical protein n=1 Tax=Tolypothrix sp. VBCCA 56010 TaxID=3137731 RepID=UPI003D7F0CEB
MTAAPQANRPEPGPRLTLADLRAIEDRDHVQPDPLAWLDHEAHALELRGFPRRQLDQIVRIGRQDRRWPTWPIADRGDDPVGLLADDLQQGSIVVLMGGYGTGKTTLATTLVWRALHAMGRRDAAANRRPFRLPASRARFAAAQDYIEDVRTRGFAPGTNVGKIIRADTEAVPLLVLDELHQVRGSDDDDLTLDRILNDRYERMAGTVLVTNLKPKPFEEFMRARNLSRLAEAGQIITCTWGSFREP